jgi:hypothetical protein
MATLREEIRNIITSSDLYYTIKCNNVSIYNFINKLANKCNEDNELYEYMMTFKDKLASYKELDEFNINDIRKGIDNKIVEGELKKELDEIKELLRLTAKYQMF